MPTTAPRETPATRPDAFPSLETLVFDVHCHPSAAIDLIHLSLSLEVSDNQQFADGPNGSLPTDHFEQITNQMDELLDFAS